MMRDKEDELHPSETMAGTTFGKRTDLYAVTLELLNPERKWITTNIKNSADMDKIMQARTYCDIADAIIESFITIYTTSKGEPALSEEQAIAGLTIEQIKEFALYQQQTRQVVLNVTENYAELRLSTKGFRAKQIEDILKAEMHRIATTMQRLISRKPDSAGLSNVPGL